MKKWNRTTIVWDCHLGLETNIPVTDWKDKTLHWHKIHSLHAVLLLDRKAEINIQINRVSISPTTMRQKIVDVLSNFDQSRKLKIYHREHYDTFKIVFELKNNEQFCETMINMVGLLYDAFEIEAARTHRQGEFMVFQDTLVKVKDFWVPFTEYLKFKKGFYQGGFMYDKKIRVGDSIFAIDYVGAIENNVSALVDLHKNKTTTKKAVA